MISLEEVKKLELVVATIKEVKNHPAADKLYILKINLPEGEKQLVAGIKPYYSQEELVGKQIILIKNLAPAVIRGVESQGMLLAAEDKEGISILIPDRKVEDGAIIR